MKISRLDKIIENNVTFSTAFTKQDQTVYILQDISATLAMIYDLLKKESSPDENDDTTAKVIPFNDLWLYEGKLHFEAIDFQDGYDVVFIKYDTSETIDAKSNTKTEKRFAVLNAFDSEMNCKESEYNKKWRCWNIKPTEEERSQAQWEK